MKETIQNKPSPARLIPSFSDSEKEQHSTSILLACFRIVPDFAKEILQEIGVSASKRSTVSTYTEIVFKKDNKTDKKSRPDGLIIIKSNNKVWSAIVESKVGNNLLTKQQIEEYLDLAKLNGVNALITISNQFVTIPTHSPVQISKQKIKSTDLFHFSWLSIQTKATLLLRNKIVSDPEQAFILAEFIHYLKDSRSGVSSFTQMSKGWREISINVNKGVKVKKSGSFIEDTISSWQQYSKYLSIRLSELVGQPVYEYISRSRTNDPAVNYEANVKDLTNDFYLDAEFEIPNAASRLHLIADFNRRTISIIMSLNAPQDRKYPQACINWLTRQILGLKDENLDIRANWPRGITEMKKLKEALENPTSLVPIGIKSLPRTLDVVEVIDLAGKFGSSKLFVEATTKAILKYYENVGQNLRKWVPKPLKVKKEKTVENPDSPIVIINEQGINPFWMPPANEEDNS